MMWQGGLALKNDNTSVQMHFVRGSEQLATVSLPPMGPQGSLGPLRIAQRMRLEQVQLDQLARRMQVLCCNRTSILLDGNFPLV